MYRNVGMMKLAILMSTYNGSKFLRQQLESIQNQICDCAIDIWVRDDGSSDDTHKILEEYAADGRLQWYTAENLKPAKSFLDLVIHCPGYDYYAFSDQDDVWYPDKLQRGIDNIRDLNIPAMSFANAHLVDGTLNSLGRNVHRNLPNVDFYSITCGANIMGCTIVFNSMLAKLIQCAPMPKELIMHDYYLGVVCTLHDGVIVYDHVPCMDYRQHGNNVIGSSSRKLDALKNRISYLMVKAPKTLDLMAASICENYPDVPNREKWEWLYNVSRYRESFFRAAKLALDRRPTYNSRNMEITLRLSILLRNR